MDAERFDALARAFSWPVARRTLLAGSLAGPLMAVGGATARNRSHAKKRKEHHRRGGPRRSAPPSCSDGVMNGSETDVDCGGACRRCPNGKRCRGQDDCESGLCVSNVCQACVFDTDCGIDAAGPCRCDTVDRETQQRVCNNASGGPSVDNCANCPAGTNCHRVDLGEWVCRSFCGVP